MGNTEKGMVKIAMDKGNWRIGSITTLRNKTETLTVSTLRDILARLQERHPVLKMAVYTEGEKKQKIYWEEKSNLEIPVTEYHNNEDPMSIWKEHASKPLKNGAGVCSLVFISGTEYTSLIVFLEHLAGDASSYTNLCHEILTAISEGEKADILQKPLNLTASIEEHVIKTLGGSFKSRLACFSDCFHFFSRMIKKHVVFPIHPEYKKIKVNELTQHVEQSVFTTTYSVGQTSELLRICKEHRTSITGFVGAAVSDAFAKVYKNHNAESAQVPVLNNCAVNTRKLYSEPLSDEYLGCHYSFTAPVIIMASGNNDRKEVMSNAASYQQETTESVASKYPLGFSLFTGWVRSRSSDNYAASRDASVFLTNWGPLKLNRHYGAWEVTSFMPLITLTRLASISIIVSSFADSLRLTLSGPTPFFKEQDLSDLHDYTNRTLTSLLKNESEQLVSL